MKTKLDRTQAITEIGESIQIRIQYEDAERLKKLKQTPEEPWYSVVHRVLVENAKQKKELSHKEVKIPSALPGNVVVTELKAEQLDNVYTQT